MQHPLNVVFFDFTLLIHVFLLLIPEINMLTMGAAPAPGPTIWPHVGAHFEHVDFFNPARLICWAREEFAKHA